MEENPGKHLASPNSASEKNHTKLARDNDVTSGIPLYTCSGLESNKNESVQIDILLKDQNMKRKQIGGIAEDDVKKIKPSAAEVITYSQFCSLDVLNEMQQREESKSVQITNENLVAENVRTQEILPTNEKFVDTSKQNTENLKIETIPLEVNSMEILNDDTKNTNSDNLQKTDSNIFSETLDIHEKLKEMGEISVKPVSKNEPSPSKRKDGENEISLEIKKKNLEKFDTEDSKRITNLRKNIREVMDENQLDATTLAAQRQESERLARVQEQQKIIRELQRQMAAERQNNRTQNRVLSLLQGQTSIIKNSANSERVSLPGSSTDMYIVKGVASEVTFKGSSFVDVDKISSGNLTPSVSIAPVRRLKATEELSESDSDKKEVVTIVDSSSEDDCIVLSDDDEDLEDEPEDDPHNSGLHVNDAYNISDDKGRVVINIGHPEGEPDIFVAPQIARVIKPHQIGGVRFLFDNIIESTERFSTSTGFGCILAHSMGLGKTLQIVCFCDIFLRHTNSKSILCIMPINTIQNWVSEFNMWLPADSEKCCLKAHGEVRPRNFRLFVLNDQYKTLGARSKVILEWARSGGVLLIGYELYRLLSLKMTNKKKKGRKAITESVKCESEAHKKLMEDIHYALVKPGPDLVICDEGHRIKNSHASISIALKQIRSKRRIVLTGYPLQNNLLEYWCMVDFVRPNYLGTKTEFSNMFERPIQNGQCIDSTPQDIKLMRYRAHVLHSLLVGFVQRRSHVVLQNALPQKEEYVILIRMTHFQRKLYEIFMNEVVRTKAVPNPLKAFAVCCKIWNHPDVLYNFLKKREADLDLELEEVEGESSTSTTTSRGKKKPSPKKAKEISKDGKTIPAIEVLPNQGKVNSIVDKTPQEIQNPKESPSKQPLAISEQISTSVSLPVAPNQYENNFPNFNSYNFDNFCGSFANLYQQLPYANHNYDSTYISDPQNNFWQNNSNYYGYSTTSPGPVDPYGQVEPSYNGMTPKATESFDQSKPPSAEEKSSEIVDLDTKEIKTVETNINSVELQKLNDAYLETKSSNSIEEASTLIEKEHKITKEDGIPYEWAVELMKGYVPDLLDSSPKMVIFFHLLEESLKLGDRILVFSQSLLTLNLIERFLQKNKVPGYDFFWTKNSTYFRLDGSTTAMEREKLINEFNANPQIHLFLVSTRAGSLGINLVGANRVIVFDASWNPCHDTQAVCRVYRYGQKKPCFVYRIVMDNCLEKKIYDRQVNKQGMSDRVVDECNPDAHLSMKEVTNLCFDNEEDTEIKDLSNCKDKYLDIVMQKIIEVHSVLLSKEPFHHESLLVDRKEKKLSQAEKRLAQRGYEMEKRATAKPYIYHSVGTQYKVMRTPDGAIVHRPVASVRPMQAEVGDKFQGSRPGGVRPTRWIPAEVWQRQGMTAQEMTLPLDVVIPTSSGDKANIVLKAGQKVMVLKSSKGIYMQLETGKIIAIRTSFKIGQNKEKSDDNDVHSSIALNVEDTGIKCGIKADSIVDSSQISTADIVPMGTNNMKIEETIRNNISFTVGRQIFENNKKKPFESHSQNLFKTQINSAQHRNLQPNSTAKPFNVQRLIDSKSSVSPHATTHNSKLGHNNNDDVIMIQDSSYETSITAHGNKPNFSNPANKIIFQKGAHSSASKQQINPHMANVKPQLHEHKGWDQNIKTPSHTITIDDDIEQPLREKVVYKPNLVDRKQRSQSIKNSQGFQSNQQHFSKVDRQLPRLITAHTNQVPLSNTNIKSSLDQQAYDSIKQLQNVKPYGRQNQLNKKQNSPPEKIFQNNESNSKSFVKQKMPTIRNIPAPYPSICAAQGVTTTTLTSQVSLNYINNHPKNPKMSLQETSVLQKNDYPSGTQLQQQAPVDLNSQMQSQQSQQVAQMQKLSEEQSEKEIMEKPESKNEKRTEYVNNPLQSTSNTSPKDKSKQTTELQYVQYNHPIASTQYGTSSHDPSISNYSRLEHGYQQHYPSMYGTATPHAYNYPPPTQPAFPYSSYNPYDPHLYSNSQTNASSNFNSQIPSNGSIQPSQYHYAAYPPPQPPAVHAVPEQYNPYYTYPPYNHQPGQWQQ